VKKVKKMIKSIWVDNLRKRYGDRWVVDGVSLRLSQGEVVGLLGPNGAGKSTTFNMIVGMVQPDAGRVSIDSDNITKLPMYKRARRGVGYLPQEASIFRKLNVEDNLMAILETRPLNKKQRKEKMDELLEEFRITHIRKSISTALSGGERRRLEIARALVSEPEFLFLDEPFAGIDPIAVEDIQGVIHDLRKRNMGILITDHNVRETLAITDRAYIVFKGKILVEGTAEHLAQDEEAKRIYLGSSFELKNED
jgi:lipopolysaccharide export system ATP-binding protein